MNTFKKIYCRTFQTGFKLAIPFLPYRAPRCKGSVTAVTSIMKNHGCDTALIVTDPSIIKLGLLEKMLTALEKANLNYHIYDKTVANPTSSNVEEARIMYLLNKCDIIIGFGGGSSIDCAKAVGARIAKPKQSLSDMAGILRVGRKLPVLVAVPTTAGTGSETTLAAVITDSETRHKYAINDFPLIPKYAILDPTITKSLPPHLTATTGMDALTHAIEAYIGNSTTYGTRYNAKEAIRLIFNNLDKAYLDGNNLTARKNMLKAAYYAGCAFSKSYVGYVHAVAHSLGGEYNIPHGLANAVLLPYVLEAYGSSIHKKLKDLAIVTGLATKDTPDDLAARRFIEAIKVLKRQFKIGDSFSQIQEEDIPKLAAYADKEANPLYPVPVLMDAKELEVFYRILKKKKHTSK